MKRFLVVMALIVPFGVMAILLRYMVVEPDQPSKLASVPLNIGNWIGEDFAVSEGTASSLRATDSFVRGYVDGEGNVIGLFIAYFRDQKYGSQIHSPRHCLPGGGWVLTNQTRIPFDLGTRKVMCNRMTIAKRSQINQMYYWFHTRSGDLASEYSLKFDLVKNSLLLNPTDAAIIRVTVDQGKMSAEECQKIAERFMQTMLDPIRQALPFPTI